jgi:transposase
MKVKLTPKLTPKVTAKLTPKRSLATPASVADGAGLPKPKRSFDEAFRQHAIALVRGGRRVADVAEELGVSTFSLYGWCRKLRRQIDLKAPVAKTMAGLEEEIVRLREALQRSQLREEILKKSLGICVAAPASPSPWSTR